MTPPDSEKNPQLTTPISVVVAEDEPLVRGYLQDLIDEREGFIVVATAKNGAQAVEAVRRHQPDLLLLDIEMPVMTGIDVLGALGDEAPPAIFVTAYDRYSLQAFDLHAIDYVLKPIDEARFFQALDRSFERVKQGELHQVNQRLLHLLSELGVEPEEAGVLETPPADVPLARLSVYVRGGWLLLDVEDIDWIGGAGVYAQIYVGDQRYLLRETLRALEERLPSPPFARVHRSAIVNRDRIQSVQTLPHGDYLLHLADDTPIRVSRRYRDSIAALVHGKVNPEK